MLYNPERHEAGTSQPWSEDSARQALIRIVAATEDAFSEARYWPLHPLDEEEGEPPGLVHTSLYYGAAGVFWALHQLQALGAVSLSRDYMARLDELLARHHIWLNANADEEHASYLMGDTPIRMMAFGLDPTPARSNVLESLIGGNLEHPSRELMWGAPGTMLAACFLHERSGDPRWRTLFCAAADRLWEQLDWSEAHGCACWQQTLYGYDSHYLGAAHGFAGCAAVLIRGRDLLGPERWERWSACIVNTVRRTALCKHGQVNWPPQLDSSERELKKGLLQFCHGAPGMLVSLGAMPGQQLDDLLLAAGHTIWAAGPLRKGASLCHGTAGNGYALLALYRRTGDGLWLERARAFAMHAIGQARQAAGQYGQWRHSLWTGDLGLAMFLWDCLRAETAFPTLATFYPPR